MTDWPPKGVNWFYADKWTCIAVGDCRDIVPLLPKVSVIVTDPPYGISHPTDYKKRGRGNLTSCRDYTPVFEDEKPFDPSHLLALGMPIVLWGANYFADKLPVSSGWLVWDKERPDNLDQATCELAWTNFVKGARRLRHLWNGMMRAGNETLYHPTQKPVALSRWVLTLPWTPTGTMLDPYMGAGGSLVAAKSLGRRAIGVEIEPKYAQIAVDRLRQEYLFTPPDPEPVIEQEEMLFT